MKAKDYAIYIVDRDGELGSVDTDDRQTALDVINLVGRHGNGCKAWACDRAGRQIFATLNMKPETVSPRYRAMDWGTKEAPYVVHYVR